MMLAVVRQRLRENRQPARDIVLTFTADEEAGGTWGARWLVDNHPGRLRGCHRGSRRGRRLQHDPRQPAALSAADGGEGHGVAAADRAGHGRPRLDGAAGQCGHRTGGGDRQAGRHEWPTRLIPSVQAFLEGVCQALDIEFIPNDPTQALSKIGAVSRVIGATLRNTVNPTVLRAGYKVNVVPQTATAEVDGRFLPGYEDEFFAELDRVLGPGVTREFIHTDIAVETTPDGDLYDAMTSGFSPRTRARR